MVEHRIIRRSEWGARWGDGRYHRRLPATEAWLHHTVTVAPDLKPPFDDDDAAVRRLDEIGKERFGAVYGIPYTFAVTPVGRIYEGHAVGQTGVHTDGHNRVGIGIGWVGNYHEASPTRAMVEATGWLLRRAHTLGWLAAPRLDGGHRDVASTLCPGDFGYAAIPEINRLARARRYDMLVYVKRGTPDALAGLAVHEAAPRGVVTSDISEARAALDRGETVLAVGGPAADELPDAEPVVGATALDTIRRLTDRW